jgi:type II secretory ATPase GspE/PulE/Tfp pilus assembly ATPase PilB-like protein
VHEVLVLDEALEKSILSKAPAQEIEKIARGE